MSNAVELWEHPKPDVMYMLAGWRQWADAGSISSSLPRYLIQQLKAEKIGQIRSDDFYLFQIPGTHDLVRPSVEFNNGYPESLEIRSNDIYYTGDDKQGLVIFVGDEPHLNIEQYTAAFIEVARQLNVRRIVSFAGVYAELPFDKERSIHGIYSLPSLKRELDELELNYSNYAGGASIGSYLCRRAGDENIAYVGLYAFVPTYDFSGFGQYNSSIRIENDFMAWLGVLRRVNYMLKTNIDLTDLEGKSRELVAAVQDKIAEIKSQAPGHGIQEYFEQIEDSFEEKPFNPISDVWKDELDRLLDDDEE